MVSVCVWTLVFGLSLFQVGFLLGLKFVAQVSDMFLQILLLNGPSDFAEIFTDQDSGRSEI